MEVKDTIKKIIDQHCIPVKGLEYLIEYTKTGNYEYIIYNNDEFLHVYKTKNKKISNDFIVIPKEDYLHSLTFDPIKVFVNANHVNENDLNINENTIKESRVYLLPSKTYKLFNIK